MFNQAENILNPLFLTLTVLFIIFISLRIRGIFLKKKPRAPVWESDIGLSYRISGIFKAISLPLMAVAIIFMLPI